MTRREYEKHPTPGINETSRSIDEKLSLKPGTTLRLRRLAADARAAGGGLVNRLCRRGPRKAT